MQVRYYSEVLDKSFETEEACKFAEKAHERKLAEEAKKNENKTARKEEIKSMYEELNVFMNKILEKEREYAKDYNEMSFPNGEIIEILFGSNINPMFSGLMKVVYGD